MARHFNSTFQSSELLRWIHAFTNSLANLNIFRSGSVVAKYRIAWRFKEGIHNAKDPITLEMLQRKIDTILQRNQGLIDSYHIADRPISAQKITDLCQIQNNGCEHLCKFDYGNRLDFICTCPKGMKLAADGKKCEETPATAEPSPEPHTTSKENKVQHYVRNFHFSFQQDQSQKSFTTNLQQNLSLSQNQNHPQNLHHLQNQNHLLNQNHRQNMNHPPNPNRPPNQNLLLNLNLTQLPNRNRNLIPNLNQQQNRNPRLNQPRNLNQNPNRNLL